MEKDDHLSNYDIADYDYGKFGIDWVGDEREDEDGFNGFVNATPSELFTVNRDNRSVTVNRDNVRLILRRMINTIRDYANALNEDNITNWMETYNLEHSIENYLGNNALFYYENELMSLNQFIKDVACGDCTTLYIGAMLDYHIFFRLPCVRGVSKNKHDLPVYLLRQGVTTTQGVWVNSVGSGQILAEDYGQRWWYLSPKEYDEYVKDAIPSP